MTVVAGFWLAFFASWLLPDDSLGITIAFIAGGILVCLGLIALAVTLIRQRR